MIHGVNRLLQELKTVSILPYEGLILAVEAEVVVVGIDSILPYEGLILADEVGQVARGATLYFPMTD